MALRHRWQKYKYHCCIIIINDTTTSNALSLMRMPQECAHSSLRTAATDIDDCRLWVSTPADFTSNVDPIISNALSDCGIEFAHGAVRMPRSMFFVPSELERLMEALVQDDLWRPPRRSAADAAHDSRSQNSSCVHFVIVFSRSFNGHYQWSDDPRTGRSRSPAATASAASRGCRTAQDGGRASWHDALAPVPAGCECWQQFWCFAKLNSRAINIGLSELCVYMWHLAIFYSRPWALIISFFPMHERSQRFCAILQNVYY